MSKVAANRIGALNDGMSLGLSSGHIHMMNRHTTITAVIVKEVEFTLTPMGLLLPDKMRLRIGHPRQDRRLKVP